MSKACAVAALALLLLTAAGCSADDPTVEGVITGKQFVAAHTAQEPDQWDGQMWQPGRRHHEPDCWRIDVKKRARHIPFGGTYTTHYCLTTAEYDTLHVGDRYTSPPMETP